MKIRFVEHIINFPSVEIIPNFQEFDTMKPYIKITFFDWFDGILTYRPLITPYINFGDRVNPEEVLLWADCLKASYEIATRQMPKHVEFYQKEEIVKAFLRIDEIISE